MKTKRENPLPQVKVDTVKNLKDLIKSKKTILLASIKNLPASQFQEISKKLRGKAIVKVPKKNLTFRALDESGVDAVKKLKEHIQADIAILFSDLDIFELAGELLANKSPAKAKPGQEAPEDILVQAGITDLVPGPAISELGAVGLKTKVTDGKLEIVADKVIVEKGKVISQNVADIMSKLDIKPFSIGYIPLSAFDMKENKLYLEIKIDKEGTLENLKYAFGKALPFAVEIGYATEDTIKLMIGKAGMQAKKLESLSPAEASVEKNVEETKEESDEKSVGEKVEETKKEVKKENTPEENKSEGEEK